MWEAEADNVQAIAIVIIFVSKFLEPGVEHFDKPPRRTRLDTPVLTAAYFVELVLPRLSQQGHAVSPCRVRCRYGRSSPSNGTSLRDQRLTASCPPNPLSQPFPSQLNPNSARCNTAAPPPAISCLGAFRTTAVSARGSCRHPKTCTIAVVDIAGS